MAGGSANRRIATVAAAAAASAVGAVALGAAGSVGAASFVARRLLTPDRSWNADVDVLAVTDRSITLTRTVESQVPGRYGLWVGDLETHVRVGQIISQTDSQVVRELIGVDYGQPRIGGSRWNSAYFMHPEASMGLTTEDVFIDAPVGRLPAWLVRPPRPHGRWAILLHGRGASRPECLRALTVLIPLGYTCLIPSYRNDIGAPGGPGGHYGLGLTEWEDIEAAMAHAILHGARSLMMGGWSMGGAITLQALDRARHRGLVTGAFLDSPVVDWHDVLAHQLHLNKVPGAIGGIAKWLVGAPAGVLTGATTPLDLTRADWVSRAQELTHQMLIFASRDDDFVPSGPAESLAKRRPDLIELDLWDTARHVKEWNVDPVRWQERLTAFLRRVDRL